MLTPRSEILKYDKFAGAAFKNALRLHFDSIVLFRNRSYPSAFALSILSMEEFAKSYLLENLYYHGIADQTFMTTELRKIVSNSLLSHTHKQRSFVN